MARRLNRLRKLLRRSADVQEGAACTRALVGLIGDNSLENWMQTVQLSQGMLTARLWQSQINVPMPRSLSKQLDPNDAAFWPPSSVMLSLFARESTVLSDCGHGYSKESSTAYVDPWGWFSPLQGPSLTVWFSDGEGWHCAGKLPLAPAQPSIEQRLTEDGHGVETIMKAGKLQLELLHFPSTLSRDVKGRLPWTMVYRVRALEDCDAQLALAIRPMELDGAYPIFGLERRTDGLWMVDGDPFVVSQPPGRRFYSSRYGTADVWKQWQRENASQNASSAHIDISCSVGQCSGLEVHQRSLKKGEVLSAMAVVYPSQTVSSLRRSSPQSLWIGAVEERRTLLSMGAQIALEHHQELFERVQYRLLSQVGEMDYEGCLAALALARLGFVQEAGRRLGHWIESVSVDSVLESESAAVLVWAACEYGMWTRERAWLVGHVAKLSQILEVLSSRPCAPGGVKLFGEGGSGRWSEIWRVAALLNAARALRGMDTAHQRWALVGATTQERLLDVLGPAPWSATPDRSADGSSAALLGAGWLRVVPLDAPALQDTIDYLSNVLHHNGGILSQGGAHIAKTGMWLALRRQSDPTVDAVSTLAEFASDTGALPAVKHQSKGALGDGDSLLSAAIFAFMVLDDVVMTKDGVQLGGLIRRAHDLPTPLGKVDVLDGVIQQYGVSRR